jgi:hypothetical protein
MPIGDLRLPIGPSPSPQLLFQIGNRQSKLGNARISHDSSLFFPRRERDNAIDRAHLDALWLIEIAGGFHGWVEEYPLYAVD